MTGIEPIGARVADVPAGLRLVPTDCPLCGSAEAEPVAVGHDFGWAVTQDAFLALRCQACGVVYLNPRPAPEEWGRLFPMECFAAPTPPERARRWSVTRQALGLCPPLPAGARVLEVAYGPWLHLAQLRRAGTPSWRLEAVTPHGALADAPLGDDDIVLRGRAADLAVRGVRYDAALLIHSIEYADRPVEELTAIGGLLQPGAPVIVITHNSDAWVSRMFAGRHWTGYDFPRRPCLFSPSSMNALARSVGLELERVQTLPSPETWSGSVRLLLRDWRISGPLARAVSGGPGLPGAGYAAERWAQFRRSGALIGAVLRTPAESPR